MKTEYYTLHLWGTPEGSELARAAGQTERNLSQTRRRERLDNVVDFTAWKAAHCAAEETVETEADLERTNAPKQQLLLEAVTTWTVLAVGAALLVRILLF